VCSLIDESELLRAEAVTEVEQDFSSMFDDIRIGLVHGRMKPKEKEAIMHQFRDHEIDLLIATTVIEVGVDVPNASLMIIENAERMGLSQLHQLRGRVGRGSVKSVCVLMYRAPLSENAKIRLGAVSMRVANLVRDSHWLPIADDEATFLKKEYPASAEAILKRWVEHQKEFANA